MSCFHTAYHGERDDVNRSMGSHSQCDDNNAYCGREIEIGRERLLVK